MSTAEEPPRGWRAVLRRARLLAMRGLPDLPLGWLHAVAHKAMAVRGAESWTSRLAGHRVHRYAIQGKGSGPPALLIHGLSGTSASMVPLLPALLPICRRVVLLDLPAHGQSPLPDEGPLSAHEFGPVALAAFDELVAEHGGRAFVIGNSLGGAVALYIGAHRPESVAAVVGLNPAGARLSAEAAVALPAQFDDALAGGVHLAGLLFHRTPLIYWPFSRDHARGWGSKVVQSVLDEARKGEVAGFDDELLRSIRAPTLILWGERDRLLPPTSAEELGKQISRSLVEVIPQCGHLPQLERPAYTRKRVRAFLTGLA